MNIKLSRRLSQRVIAKAALKVAINSLNPIIGVNMSVDRNVLLDLYASLRANYAISEQEVELGAIQTSSKHSLLQLILPGLRKKTIGQGVSWVQGILVGLNLFSPQATTKQARLKWLKIRYITLFTLAFTLILRAVAVYYLGKEYSKACEEYALVRHELLVQQAAQQLRSKRAAAEAASRAATGSAQPQAAIKQNGTGEQNSKIELETPTQLNSITEQENVTQQKNITEQKNTIEARARKTA